jgi:O-antigen/teichoic acid export membrane protein
MKSEESREEAVSRLARSSVIVLMSMILAKATGYLYKVAIARYATPAEFGTFSITLIVIGIGVTLSSLGLTEGLIRYIAFLRGKQKRAEIGSIIKKASKQMIGVSIIIGVLLFCMADFIASYFQENALLGFMVRLTAVSIPCTVLSGFYLALLRGHEDIKKYTFISNAAQGVLKVVLLGICLFFLHAAIALPFSYTLTAMFLALIGWEVTRTIRKKYDAYKPLSTQREQKLGREVLTYSLPLLYTGIVFSLLFWTDSLVIGRHLPPEQVGMYAVAITLVSLLGILPELFMQLFFPLLSGYFAKHNLKDIHYLVQRVSTWVIIGNVPLALALCVFPGAFVNLFFSNAYAGAAESIRILAIGGLIGSLTNGLSALLTAQGRTRLMACNVTCMVMLNLILNILLVKRYGIEGVATATAITWCVFISILFFQVRKTIKGAPLPLHILVKVLLATTVYLWFLEWFGSNAVLTWITILGGIGIGMVLYLSVLIVLKVFDAQDRAVFLSLIKRARERLNF